jgi:hypothetical protein
VNSQPLGNNLEIAPTSDNTAMRSVESLAFTEFWRNPADTLRAAVPNRVGIPRILRRCQPRAVRHRHGAQVALLRCPIPCAGKVIVPECAGGHRAVNSRPEGPEPP